MEEEVKPKTDHWPKCWSAPYIGRSFYFRSDLEGVDRITAWTSDLDRAKQLFYKTLQELPDEVGILLKRAYTSEDQTKSWRRFFGEAKRQTLTDIIKEHEDLIFRESDIQFCVRDMDTGEYIVFDEWGAIFIYSADLWFDHLCEQMGYKKEKPEDHVSSHGHFRLHPPNTDLLFESFVNTLGLAPAEPFKPN